MLLSLRRLATSRALNMSSPPPRPYTLKFGTDYDYNYDPDGTRTPPTYLDPYDPEYCAPSTPPPASSSRLYSSALDRLESVKRRSLSPRARSKTPAAPPGPPIPTSPTPEYLETSQEPSNDLETPDELRKLLVLDLNGTLVYRSPHKLRKFAPRRPGPGRYRHEPPPEEAQDWDPYADPTAIRPLRVVHGRPYLNSFREYLFHPETKKWLDTMVWSSAQPHSVSDMVDKSFGEKKSELVAVWARDTLGLNDQDYNKKTQTTKDLAKPWAGLPLPKSTPKKPSEPPQRHSARTSLLLDDSPKKAHLQPWNHLCIKEYTGEMRSHDLLVLARENTIKRLTAGAGVASEAPAESTNDVSAGPPSSPPAGDEAHAEATAAPDSEAATTEAPDEDPLDPRKEKKKRKRAAKNAARLDTMNNPSTPAPKYDSTLLAVVGVLDAVKHQSNVAGWMRSGSLKLAVEEEGEAEPSEVGAVGDEKTVNRKPGPVQGESSIESLASVQDYPKKRRVSDAGVDDSVPVGGVKPDASRTKSLERKDSAPQAATPASDASLANIGDSGQWFEDKEIVDKWVARGVNALEELGIEVQSGIVNHGN